jgi:hypothetical protein
MTELSKENIVPKKKSAMIETLRIRQTSQEACDLDVGEIPGDHLGAGGFDSSLCTYKHVRKWIIIVFISIATFNTVLLFKLCFVLIND